jgi:hypothetical protein
VKLLRTTPDGFVFHISAREKDLLFEMLQLYPLVPVGHQRLTQSPAQQSDENQRLLEESLAEHRAANRRQVEALLKTPERFVQRSRGLLLTLATAEVECLLQVLNDIRVGSWLALGEPDESRPPEITPENFRFAVAMEVCGAFESVLLSSFGETESPDWIA